MNGHMSAYRMLAVQRLRDHILAVLRDTSGPLTAAEIAARVLAPIHTRLHTPMRLRVGQVDKFGLGNRVVADEGNDFVGNHIYVIASPAPPEAVYPHLQALQRAALITVERDKNHCHRHLWSYTDAARAARLREALELSFALPDAGRR